MTDANSEFVYTTFIKSTPEKVWQAITTPEFTRQYWGLENISDWKKGSSWQHVMPDTKAVRIFGEVLETNPPHRLVISWASPSNEADVSKVVFDISIAAGLVRLDVIHSSLSEDMGRGVTGGWPRVLSSMKTFLETGEALDIWALHKAKQEAKCA